MAGPSAVAAFWDAAPCGSKLAASPAGSPAFFAEVERTRELLDPHIAAFAGFERWRDRSVLEIGVGLGSDSIRFARAGASVSGIDLSARSIELARARFQLEERAADLRVGDGEQLPFEDGSFDLVYSWGVIHHAPRPRRVVEEIRRVLAPGGEVRAMLYARRSWFGLAVWARHLARGNLATQRTALAQSLESPGTQAYTAGELRRLFDGFADVRIERWVTSYDRRVAGPLAALAGSRLGWNFGVTARRD